MNLRITKSFSTAYHSISLHSMLLPKRNLQEVKVVANNAIESLHKTGLLCIQDPRAVYSKNQDFMKMFDSYFSTRAKQFEKKVKPKIKEYFPETGHNTGLTPEFTETARDHKHFISKLSGPNLASTKCPNIEKDPKWRYILRVGEKDPNEPPSLIDPPRAIPENFPGFEKICDEWGMTMLNTIEALTELLEIGFGIPIGELNQKLKGGVNVLGPTGSNLLKYNVGTVLAALHYDLSYFTIHGKSNYPGLFVWTRDGTKIPVSVPKDHFLVQAGREIEYLTGGYIKAGMHEVVLLKEAKEMAEEAVKEGKSPWRISSTLFSHVKASEILQPIPYFRTNAASGKYKPITAEEHMIKEFSDIGLIPDKAEQ